MPSLSGITTSQADGVQFLSRSVSVERAESEWLWLALGWALLCLMQDCSLRCLLKLTLFLLELFVLFSEGRQIRQSRMSCLSIWGIGVLPYSVPQERGCTMAGVLPGNSGTST